MYGYTTFEISSAITKSSRAFLVNPNTTANQDRELEHTAKTSETSELTRRANVTTRMRSCLAFLFGLSILNVPSFLSGHVRSLGERYRWKCTTFRDHWEFRPSVGVHRGAKWEPNARILA